MQGLNSILEWGKFVGYPIVVLISLIGIRYLFYFRSYFFHWSRYRQLETVTTNDVRALPFIPFIKVQITTRGSAGSTEVIRRGIANVLAFVSEAPDIYRSKLSIEVVTESQKQKYVLEREFGQALIPVYVFVLPGTDLYETPNVTKLKARALHYMVELRRAGINRKPGKTFIVHYDEESVMEPDELRKLVRYLATTDKQLTEGPIYYPLEYGEASVFCRAMEANRPIGCFECREVMETGTPLHLHGSNLVIDEALENELGWDIGNLDGEPFIAEDYVFGVLAYLKRGPKIFGWHGCVMLEQPPFSFRSAFKQRYRWIVGILQGMALMGRKPEFRQLSTRMRFRLVWGTRYRVLTFALGLPTGIISLLYVLFQTGMLLYGRAFVPLPLPIMCWLLIIGFLWLNSIFIGSWYNISSARQLSVPQRITEVGRVLTLAPISGILESTAGFWALFKWIIGKRQVSWQPTPKTRKADNALHMKRRAGNTKLAWRFAVASFVSIMAIGASFQWLLVSGNTSFTRVISTQLNPSLSASPVSQVRDQSTSMSLRFHRPTFQTGVVFPQWGTTAYSNSDANWQVGLNDIQKQTAAQWIELPINFYQSPNDPTQILTTDSNTPTPEAVAAGIRLAHAKHYHVFVVPLLTVTPGRYSVPWSGSIQFGSVQETTAWFTNYWQAYQPYVIQAAKAGAEQLAIGTEFELLQTAPGSLSLWNQLIANIHQIFHGKLTYDINWSSLYYYQPPHQYPLWLSNPYLSAIGVSVYNPLTQTPQFLDPNKVNIPALWQETIGKMLDTFSVEIGKPLLVSEIGYRDSMYAFYDPWERDASAEAQSPDPIEQAAGYNAALTNVLSDKYVIGIFFWAWSIDLYQPNYKPAAQVLHKWYTSPMA